MCLAVGSMGMSLDDFCSMSPHDFFGTLRSWHRTKVEQPWEQTRFLACCLLQPWSKKRLRPEDVCSFQWDRKGTKKAHPAEPSTRQRFEELKRRCGG